MLPRPRPSQACACACACVSVCVRERRRLVFPKMGCRPTYCVKRWFCYSHQTHSPTVKTDRLWASQFLRTNAKAQATTGTQLRTASEKRRQGGSRRDGAERRTVLFLSLSLCVCLGLASCGPRLPPEMASRNNDPKRGRREYGHDGSSKQQAAAGRQGRRQEEWLLPSTV